VLDAGASAIQSFGDLAECEAVLIMVNTMDQVHEVLIGEGGLVPCLKGQGLPLTIIMSTVSPDHILALASTLAPHSARILDAPVSGGPFLAELGRLAIMAGGQEDELEHIRPVFEAMADHIFHVGPLGTGMAMKLVNNCIGLAMTLAVPEALALGRASGLDMERMVEIINASSGKTFFTENWPLIKVFLGMVLEKEDTFGVRNALFTTGMKDLKTAQQWAAGKGFSAPVLDSVAKALELLREEDVLENITMILK
jgi:3-hydroxyisobutyrate dehydrogenase-like beta-hydroxyacid dehydrogenase